MQDVALCGSLKKECLFCFFKANITVSVTGGGERGGERLQLQEDLGVRLFLRLGEKQVRLLTCLLSAHVHTLNTGKTL